MILKLVQLMRHLFTFPIYFKCWMTTEWSTLSSFAPSYVVVRGSASMMALNQSLPLLMADHWALKASQQHEKFFGIIFFSFWVVCSVVLWWGLHAASPRSAAARAPVPMAGHCWPVTPQETFKHSKAGLTEPLVGSLGPGAHELHTRLFEPF